MCVTLNVTTTMLAFHKRTVNNVFVQQSNIHSVKYSIHNLTFERFKTNEFDAFLVIKVYFQLNRTIRFYSALIYLNFIFSTSIWFGYFFSQIRFLLVEIVCSYSIRLK